MNTSAHSMSPSSAARPSSLRRSIATPRLLRLNCSNRKLKSLGVGDDAQLRHDVAQRITRRSLDLDDVGTPVGEDRRGRRHEAVLRDLEHA